jgi:hypothetical protein
MTLNNAPPIEGKLYKLGTVDDGTTYPFIRHGIGPRTRRLLCHVKYGSVGLCLGILNPHQKVPRWVFLFGEQDYCLVEDFELLNLKLVK